ncbi:PP2C family protein-serine/threonine phosphatase [Streptomyces sp. NPDC006879]|uniref:PP2C family protein-serine/threonine phosphatase n=1 Tax=Streptomyces sp. NPDC006879 TaxID=3364767 RepID=UPI0036C57BBF
MAGQPVGHTADAAGADTRLGATRRFVRLLPPLLICFGLLFAVLTPADFTGSPFFSAAPLVAAPFFGMGATLITGGTAWGILVLLHLHQGSALRMEAVTELLTVLTVAALAVLINRVVRRGDRQLASARGVAEVAQRAVLPKPAERLGGLEVAARYEAAHADAFIGGDLYAVQETPFGVRLAVGDVRGKGLDAVEVVAVVIGAFREAAEQEPDLQGVARRLERALVRERARYSESEAAEGFTTCVLAEVPREELVVRLLNRGHPEPLLLYADGRLDRLAPEEPALPLGLGELAPLPGRVVEWPFPAGAMLLLHTDGLTEARDAGGVFYDPAERLRGRIFPGPDGLLSALISDVRRHTGGGTTDDLALLAVGRPGAGQPVKRRTVAVVAGDEGGRSGPTPGQRWKR